MRSTVECWPESIPAAKRARRRYNFSPRRGHLRSSTETPQIIPAPAERRRHSSKEPRLFHRAVHSNDRLPHCDPGLYDRCNAHLEHDIAMWMGFQENHSWQPSTTPPPVEVFGRMKVGPGDNEEAGCDHTRGQLQNYADVLLISPAEVSK